VNYSPLGERLYKLLSTELTTSWRTHAMRLIVGRLSIVPHTDPKVIRVIIDGQSGQADTAMSQTLTEDDNKRLHPMVVARIAEIDAMQAQQTLEEALKGVKLGPARDPARSKLTRETVNLAKAVLEAAASDTVGVAELSALCDKVREDLEL